MTDRYPERGQRWEDSERRHRDREREYSDGDRGFLERFADEMRSWFGNEEAQRRRMMDEREDWRGVGGSNDRWRDRDREWSRSDWPRGESSRTSTEWRGPDERQWSRGWGWVEGPGSGSYRSSGYSTSGLGSYGTFGRERDWGRQGRETHESSSRDWMTMHGPHSGRGPRNYQRSDERIREDLCERFTQHSYLDPTDIDVRVQNAQVTLDGTVSDRWAKRTAEDLADSVWGVKEVHNLLRIVPIDLGQEPPREERREQGGTGPQRGTWAA